MQRCQVSVKPSAISNRAGRRHVHAKCLGRGRSRDASVTPQKAPKRGRQNSTRRVDENAPPTPSSRLAHDYTMKL